jgi:uncharacterized membrane protein
MMDGGRPLWYNSGVLRTSIQQSSIKMLIALLINVWLIPFDSVESFSPCQRTKISSSNDYRGRDRNNFIVAHDQQPYGNKKFVKNFQQRKAFHSTDKNEGNESKNNNDNIGEIIDTTDAITRPQIMDVIEVMDSSISSSQSNEQQQPKYICDMDNSTQQIAFIMSFVLLGFGTTICIQLWYSVVLPIFGIEYFLQIQTIIFPILFGSIFTLVGIGHFIYVQNFARIVPPYNTWGGLWKIPAPFSSQLNISYEEYHSYWTGIVEFVGGIWLFYTGINHINTDPSLPAILLFLLTVIVTPANIYMFTHNASPGGIIPPLSYPYGHLLRFLLQCGLLSNFYIMIHPLSI